MNRINSFLDTMTNNHTSNGDVQSILSSISKRAPLARPFQRQRADTPPKNFKKENLQRLREIQRSSQQRELAKENPGKVLWHSKEYRSIPSRLSGYMKTGRNSDSASTMATRSRSLDRRVPQNSNTMVNQRDEISTEHEENLKIPKLLLKNKVVSADIINKSDKQQKSSTVVNKEVRLNRVSSTPNLANVLKTKTAHDSPIKHHQVGVVPKYLLIRKKQWRDEEARREQEAKLPEVPPGHKLLSEEQRLETLNLLQERYKNVLSKISSLPVCSDTLRVRRLKENYETQMLQTEEAIKIFSHSKVYIKNDD